ncbi:hypothetical protein RF644_17860 [Kocuria sp. CPCC 205258]|uniref:hypothetical protein n=1 Tax=Kocuria sp. CPCC 205258 TaxID=3073552 RepID=UPI0034D6295C
MVALISLPFLLAFLIWFAVRTDNVLLGIGLAIGSVIGTQWRDKRKARKQARQDARAADYDAMPESR